MTMSTSYNNNNSCTDHNRGHGNNCNNGDKSYNEIHPNGI